MSSLLKQWFYISIPVVALHYILIILIWGHDPAPVSQALVFPLMAGNEALAWHDLGFEIPKLTELLLGPLIVLKYLFNKENLPVTAWSIKMFGLLLFSFTIGFWYTALSIMCFVATGSMLTQNKSLVQAVTLATFFAYASAVVMWSFPQISLGIIGWSFSFVSLMIGFIIGVAVKPRKIKP